MRMLSSGGGDGGPIRETNGGRDHGGARGDGGDSSVGRSGSLNAQ